MLCFKTFKPRSPLFIEWFPAAGYFPQTPLPWAALDGAVWKPSPALLQGRYPQGQSPCSAPLVLRESTWPHAPSPLTDRGVAGAWRPPWGGPWLTVVSHGELKLGCQAGLPWPAPRDPEAPVVFLSAHLKVDSFSSFPTQTYRTESRFFLFFMCI